MTCGSPSALDTLLSAVRIDGDTAKAHIDEGWMQGRTAYGGISSAVALAGTMALHPTETPLRYAQISFVGPVGGDCTVETRVLRPSKSSLRSGASRVGKECGSTCRSRWSPEH